jgi:hypothetical protein
MSKMFASWGRVFLVAVLIKFMDLGADLFALNLDSLRHIMQAGVASMIPVIIRYLNPNDTAYGINKEQSNK